jgi:hypothetical protein
MKIEYKLSEKKLNRTRATGKLFPVFALLLFHFPRVFLLDGAIRARRGTVLIDTTGL